MRIAQDCFVHHVARVSLCDVLFACVCNGVRAPRTGALECPRRLPAIGEPAPPRSPEAERYSWPRWRYCIASARCAIPMMSSPARSAIVRASLSVRWNARAEKCRRSIAAFREPLRRLIQTAVRPDVRWTHLRIRLSATVAEPLLLNPARLADPLADAGQTILPSPHPPVCRTRRLGTSMKISMRSISGPDMRLW